MRPCDRAFFLRSAPELASALLGCVLVRMLSNGTRLAGRIIETEAYVGPRDAASHAYNARRTPRNESMYAQPGTFYVYFTYGMHHCCNASTNVEDSPQEVLGVPAYPDAGRTVFSYLAFEVNPPLHDPVHKNQTNTTQVYMQACRGLRRGKWDAQLEAKSINEYLRAGFGLVFQENALCEQ